MASLSINGEKREVDVPGSTPLLWTLRDALGLKGTKFGCGMGLCGSCTIHIDGQAVRSCITPVSAATGKQITTIEGLSDDGSHACQTAWKELSVPQCGYCQPGQIMNAAALLNSNPKPDSQDIDDAMMGNICRCGTYQRIKKAIQRAAEIQGGK